LEARWPGSGQDAGLATVMELADLAAK